MIKTIVISLMSISCIFIGIGFIGFGGLLISEENSKKGKLYTKLFYLGITVFMLTIFILPFILH